MSGNPTRERNGCGLFLFFDNFKLLLLIVALFEQAERSNSLSLEDIERVSDRLKPFSCSLQISKIITI